MKRLLSLPRSKSLVPLTLAVVLGSMGMLFADPGIDPPGRRPAENRYIGAGKCKSCHKDEESGNQYGAWEEWLHAKAFETLASDESKRLAKEQGITGDPQEAPECLECHVTAYGAPKDEIKGGFKPEMGVQCESCHGPGELHMKERFKGAASAKKGERMEIPADEIVTRPEKDVCIACHNERSPSYKPFCYYEKLAKIRHLDPRKPASPLLPCGCDDLESCSHGCPDPDCAVHGKDE